MKPRPRWKVRVDLQGRLVLPPEAATHFGLKPGSQTWLEASGERLSLRRPADHLARLYLEPTNICNLDCRFCMRNVWDEPLGWMSEDVFERVLEGLSAFDPLPLVFFGGFGEPLSHPDILQMVRRVKALGAPVELITNGILLSEEISSQLTETGIDTLWVSIDGASPESYTDLRLGAALPEVLKNLQTFRKPLVRNPLATPRLGIAFVAMQRNIADLPEVIRLGLRLGASRFSISNLLPHTPELVNEVLFNRSMYSGTSSKSQAALPEISLPRLDLDATSRAALLELLDGSFRVLWNGSDETSKVNCCPFIEKNSAAIRWDGSLSPCLPLLHSHLSYLDDRRRRSTAWSVGSLLEHSLPELWNDPQHQAFRQRLVDYDFSPCTFCNSCDMPEQNQEDCFGNSFPTCGGCLWAQGFIQCP